MQWIVDLMEVGQILKHYGNVNLYEYNTCFKISPKRLPLLLIPLKQYNTSCNAQNFIKLW